MFESRVNQVTNQQEQLSKVVANLELLKQRKQQQTEKTNGPCPLKIQDDLKNRNSKIMEMEIIHKFRFRFGIQNCKRRGPARNRSQPAFRNVRA